jgi:pyruvate kinase
MLRKTKIVATLGPASDSYEGVVDLIKAGVNVFRLNFSHGAHEKHKEVIQTIRKASADLGTNIAILADLQGPKLRIGEMENNGVFFNEGDIITFTNEPCVGNKDCVYMSYQDFALDVKVGEMVLLDDGKIDTRVTEILPNGTVKARVINSGILSSKKGVNLPDTSVSIPSLTEKDLKDLDFILEQQIEWIGLSFVRKPEDIKNLKAIIKNRASDAKIIAKIEKPEAIKHLREVILAADAVMVARGDLGVELPLEKVPSVQKDIVRMCIHRAKPVIIATQMMESMMTRTRPNRSEVTDVANAVLEGADAVMLSGETAMGDHPALVVKTMSNIIVEAEKQDSVYNRNLSPQPHSPSFLSDALCYNACKISDEINANALIGMTQSGYTAFMLSSFRPESPLYVFTQTAMLVNQLSLSWGVQAFHYTQEKNVDDVIFDQIDLLKEKGLLKTGDVVVNTGSIPVTAHLPTNMLKITKITW